ncbi:pyridoxamine 5'-phosphate oxidase family protein [Thioalkalivibrio nitratireducens DSM 14787]|uniref:Pyridoxamine 5'-phosphate oxidase family protein n=1 Tax=Thioalkalivibrio nitratireducens (strain DSM 14787 / UNIQEM 213 / ALEN2) TaxID=1255043 RepID=L0DWC0_THIND|nr:pyridoxamine 5'-phosphate oxidase [Thioalkalivibrio nitratireducens]AGA33275.1 pyridoxamine 5'-phosphate oxidase family protein [Thioalkalivibrio nitratireducens DSM 14787]
MSEHDIHRAAERLLDSVPGLVIGTGAGEGISLGHLPFTGSLEEGLVVVSSRLAAHYRALEAGHPVTCLLLEDAADCRQIYARRRMLLRCRPERLTGARIRAGAFAALEARFGGILNLLEGLPDFQAFQLHALSGELVLGFGKAYALRGPGLRTVEHLTGGG